MKQFCRLFKCTQLQPIPDMEQTTMKSKQGSAFVTTRKGYSYLTVKVGRSNFNIMRIRNYTLEPQDKRDMRRLYPDYLFDWKKINQQLAEKREVCRAYRSKRQAPRNTERITDSFVMVSYDPRTRTVYASDAGNSLALLDAVLQIERTNKK
jgi:hypothetical protein